MSFSRFEILGLQVVDGGNDNRLVNGDDSLEGIVQDFGSDELDSVIPAAVSAVDTNENVCNLSLDAIEISPDSSAVFGANLVFFSVPYVAIYNSDFGDASELYDLSFARPYGISTGFGEFEYVIPLL